MALFHCHDTATVRIQHQWLTCKLQNGINYYLKNYHSRIIIKNLTKCNILSIFAFKNYGKFADRKLKNLCPHNPWPQQFQSLASRGSALEKSVLGLGLGFVFESLVLVLASNVVSLTPLLI